MVRDLSVSVAGSVQVIDILLGAIKAACFVNPEGWATKEAHSWLWSFFVMIK